MDNAIEDLKGATTLLQIAREEADDEQENLTAYIDQNTINQNPEDSEPEAVSPASETHESESEIIEEMAEEDLIQLQILSGEKSAIQQADILEDCRYKKEQELDTNYWKNTKETDNDRLQLIYNTQLVEIDFRLKLFYVKKAIETQIKQATEVAAIPNKRSQQYQDTLVANIDALEYLEIL